jgi:hypothetical protein
MKEWMYTSTYSYAQHMRGQLHAPAALPLGKIAAVYIE